MIIARHSLVHVRADALHEALARTPFRSDVLDAWTRRGWPAVGRRRCHPDPVRQVPLGIPLLPSCGKARVAISVAPDDILDVRLPVTLRDVATAAPPAWRATIMRLLGLADDVHAIPRVFGSFAWQHLTGLAYVGAASDLDLIWPLPAQPQVLLAGLAAIEAGAPGAIDGEIVLEPGAAAVHWRELSSGADLVLVKSVDSVTLRSRRDILAITDV